MALTNELFRFVNLRPADRVLMNRVESRLIRDTRESPPLLGTLFGPGDFEPKLAAADSFALSAAFVDDDNPAIREVEPVVEFFRTELEPERALPELAALFKESFPDLARLLRKVPPGNLAEATRRFLGSLWDSLYTQTSLGCDRFVSTNYLVDAIRVYRVILLLWLSGKLELPTWTGGRFDDYHPLIDLQEAAAIATQDGKATSEAALGAAAGAFRVPLSVGEMRPPTVGDLILVEQELRRYEPSELAAIETVMRGERREHTTRNLARTTQTTTTETSSEQEETSSVSTDERFQLSSQSQTTAAQSFGLDVGVSVSGKFGPVQMGATVNASYDTSKSTTDSSAQEYAKTVTEEATKRVANSIKETSSLTILTETQDTSLRGFNNEDGTTHINGMYRWLDKVYEAKLLNYGRRLMLSLTVPEPSVYYRWLLEQNEALATADLVEPLHPSRISRSDLTELPASNTTDGFNSYKGITEANYAKLAALYDVTGLEPPLPLEKTGSKSIVVPESMPPTEMRDDVVSLVTADSTLTVDPDYRITHVGVFAPDGPAGTYTEYAEALHLGEKKDETDWILVMVGDKDFYLSATGNGDKDPRSVNHNFGINIEVNEGALYSSAVQTSVPVTVSASFTGMLNLTIIYQSTRTDEAMERWKSATWAAILKGYAAKKQAYDQALPLAKAQATSETVAQTFQLREDQYRSIELTELKRGCIDLITEGTAVGHTSISVAVNGKPTTVYREEDAALIPGWRSPLANGTVAEYFERAFEWDQTTYEFHPYYWAGSERWAETAQAAGADPIFENFLRAGSASVAVPVRPGFERTVIFFLKTGLIWGGGYLPLFTSPDMLDVYADVELGTQLDPPEQIGEPWELRLPTSLVMLQEDEELPEFPPEEPEAPAARVPSEPVPDETSPF